MRSRTRTVSSLAAFGVAAALAGAVAGPSAVAAPASEPAVSRAAGNGGFPAGQFKIRNGKCLLEVTGHGAEGVDCDGPKAVVFRYDAATGQLVGADGRCLGLWDTVAMPQMETCNAADSEQKWAAHTTGQRETSIYLAADAPGGMYHDPMFGRDRPVGDEASVRRLWSFEMTDTAGVKFRTIDVKKAAVTMNNQETGFSLLPVK
ncbi:hypothetical protein [Streptomyces sp. NPDC012746]|uniref:hypothetical protein n=1 Tax=Streptomyces sp. NPDC012746 TaxID=3364845 RepID=UPI0036B9ACD0